MEAPEKVTCSICGDEMKTDDEREQWEHLLDQHCTQVMIHIALHGLRPYIPQLNDLKMAEVQRCLALFMK